MKKEKIDMVKAVQGELDEVKEDELSNLEHEIKAIKENIESLEEKQDFVKSKMNSIHVELVSLSPDDIEQLNFAEVQSIEGARACLSAFFEILLDVNVYKH